MSFSSEPPFAVVKQKGTRVIIRLTGKPKSAQEVEEYLGKLEVIYQKKQKFVMLYDASLCAMPEYRYIRMQASFMETKEAETRKYVVRTAICVSSVIARTVLQTLFLLRKPTAPCQIFGTMEEAKQWLSSSHLPRVLNDLSVPTSIEELLLQTKPQEKPILKTEHDLEQFVNDAAVRN